MTLPYRYNWVPLLILMIGFSSITNTDSIRAQEIVNAFPNLTFDKPVDFQHANDGSNRLFVVEQAGVIRVFDNNPETQTTNVFLDITSLVDDAGAEEGLLGLAFHPEFDANGYFFVDYTASSPERTVIARYTVSGDNPDQADPESATVILEVGQPYANHNGGQIVFGPDGYLYISLGDGGSGGDPHGNGQNRGTLLGSIIRIDVDNPDGSLQYGIPPDNPFAGNTEGYREEIFAYGLRNPWRFSFDIPTGMLWTADVGQNRIEEIDIIAPGGNYGWNIMEGMECYQSENCDTSGLIMPVVQYDHSEGRSVTGGYVYRGSGAASALEGEYIYADYVSGAIWGLAYSEDEDPVNRLITDSDLRISSFGLDAVNELYALDHSEGSIYRFESTPVSVGEYSAPAPVVVCGNYPNPFNAGTFITLTHVSGQDISLVIYNSSGQAVRHLADGFFSAGAHQIFWDGADDRGQVAGTGLYLYRIETAQAMFAGAMMLLK